MGRTVVALVAFLFMVGVRAEDAAPEAEWQGVRVPTALVRWLDAAERWSSAVPEQREYILADLRFAGDEAARGLAAVLDRAGAELDARCSDAGVKATAAAARERLLALRRVVRTRLDELHAAAARDRTRPAAQDLAEALEELDLLARSPAEWAVRRGRFGPTVALLPAVVELLDLVEGGGARAARWAERLNALAGRLPSEHVVRHHECQPFAAENAIVRAENERLGEGLSPEERAVVARTNDYREAMGLRSLRVDARLVAAARGHSEEMARLDYFSHKSPTRGRGNIELRAAAEGMRAVVVGENIARGAFSPEEIVAAWRDSPGHHRNLLLASYRFTGVARAEELWTAVYAGEER